MSRDPQIGDIVFAMVISPQGSMEAARGVVTRTHGDQVTLCGLSGIVICKKEGAIVVPPDIYTAEERDLLAQILGISPPPHP